MTRQRLSHFSLIALGLIFSTLFLSTSSRAQIPDEFTNLQVLDKKISKGELISIMRGFSGALNVRCNYCHIGGNGQSLDGVEFEKDDKQAKKSARMMMSMVSSINRDFVSKLKGTSNTGMEVACITCHRGQTHPRQIEDVLMEAHSSGGYEATAAVYDSLRSEYYGSQTFDFQETVLIGIAEEVSHEGEIENALKYLKLNEKHYPKSAWNFLMMGRLYMQSGDKKSAIASVERALVIEPDSRFGKQMLRKLKQE